MKKTLKFAIVSLQFFGGEENNESQQQQENQEDANQYIQALAEVKAKSAKALEENERLKSENAALLKSIVDGGELPPNLAQQAENEKPDIASLREDLFGIDRKEMSNLETAEKLLDLRDAIMDEGGDDPFVSAMKDISPEERKTAQDAADLLRSCIEQADGNSEVFTALLQGKMQDDKLLAAKQQQQQQHRRR